MEGVRSIVWLQSPENPQNLACGRWVFDELGQVVERKLHDKFSVDDSFQLAKEAWRDGRKKTRHTESK